jgi:MoaA/NifB/PqqE/SkfB family radical SAM enzyme
MAEVLKLHNFDFSKKIFFHPEKIVAYKEGRRPFPTMLEIDLANICNHRCIFCNCADTLGSNNSVIEASVIKSAISEAYELGTRAVSFTGGGESMVHKEFLAIVAHAKSVGMDIGCITNGSLIKPSNVRALNEHLQWIRISMAGGDRESYLAVQGIDHFEKVLENVRLLLRTKAEIGGRLNIGVKIVVTPRNVHTLTNMAQLLTGIEADGVFVNYLQFIPDQFSADGGQFWNSAETQEAFRQAHDILEPKGILTLRAGFRIDFDKSELDYPRRCYAHFFQAVITATGDLTYCKNCREDSKFHLGNIREKSLKEIWSDEKVLALEEWVRPNNCGLFCKNMALNTTMENILHPDPDMTPNFVN